MSGLPGDSLAAPAAQAKLTLPPNARICLDLELKRDRRSFLDERWMRGSILVAGAKHLASVGGASIAREGKIERRLLPVY